MEQTSNVQRSEIFNDILKIIKKLKLEKTDEDSYDHPSVACELEQYFLKKLYITDVSGLACNCIGMTEVHQINDKFLCGTCGKPLRQAYR